MTEEVKHIVHGDSSGAKKIPRIRILRTWQFLTLAFGTLLLVSIITSGFKLNGSGDISAEQISEKTTGFINDNLLQGQATASVTEVKEANGLYLLKIEIEGQPLDVYSTKDGVLLFPQVINMNEVPQESSGATESSSVTKSDKPNVELFVMSHCPYGTQIEKGILPVVKELGDSIDFEVKFVNYAMHGQVEIDEELKQYCIQKEFGDNYISYLGCFLEDGNSSRCLAEAEIDGKELAACVAETDKEFGVSETFNDPERKGWAGSYPPFGIFDEANQEYGVQGSPTLVINGKIVNSGRDAESLLNTICSAFNQKPEECGTDMSSYGNPAPGFGFDTQGGSASTAGCGN